jgi:hypothetical protein
MAGVSSKATLAGSKAGGSAAAELDTWYLVCDSKKDQEECLEALIVSAKAIGSRYVQDPTNEVA